MKNIDFDGKPRAVNYGRNSLIEFRKIVGKEAFSDPAIFSNHECLRALVFVGLKWGLYKPSKGTEPVAEYTLFQVGDVLEKEPEKTLEFLNAFVEAQPKAEEEEDKKKESEESKPDSIGKELKPSLTELV